MNNQVKSTGETKGADWTSFPRCEYKTRFNGTSAFEMTNSRFWGTYYRSTKSGGNYDRLNTIKPIDQPKPQKRTARRALSGIFQSPYSRHQYFLRSTNNERVTNRLTANNGFLYDQLLAYKCKLCKIVVDQFANFGPRYIDVYIRNGFPCIIVQVPLFKGKLGEKNLYQICAAYFSAIANYIASKNEIPIEMVIRASIGHNVPTVSTTKCSFRINIGIVPEVYATTVLIESLKIINKKFQDTLTTEHLSLNGNELGIINDAISAYNQVKKGRIERWDSAETLIKVLCKKGDSSGRSVAGQITRLNQYIELLCDYVHTEIMSNAQELQLNVEPLRKILSKVCFKNNQVKMNIQQQDYLKVRFEFPSAENPEIKNEKEFWEIMQKIASAIKMTQNTIIIKKMHGLYGMLEKANSQFIEKCARQSEDGYGSDSDCEGSFRENSKRNISFYFNKKSDAEVKFFCKKVIVQTGMRAINLAFALAKCLTEEKNACTEHMYYETRDAIKNASDDISIENFNFEKSKQPKIRFIDLNFCAKTPNSRFKVNLEKIQKESKAANEKVIVFDYTSAISTKLNTVIRQFIPHMKVLLLVNSGSKNEQIGADNNPYGTIRIVTTDFVILNKLYFGLTGYLDAKNEKLPKHLHDIRKAYKEVGAVLTNKAIFKEDLGPTDEPMNSTI